MTEFVDEIGSLAADFNQTEHGGDVETAVIGIGCRLPGAEDTDQFWDLIRRGADTFRRVDPEDSARWGFRPDQVADPAFVPVTSSLADPDGFDAGYFDVPAHEAALMDPQHRVFVEAVWSALEDSGHAGDYGGMTVGLFGSVSSSTYLGEVLGRAGIWDVTDPNYAAMLANDKDFVCTRTAYLLGLTGPALVVQSACSSSLVAVHTARAALAAGECDLAVVAASSISIPHLGGYLYRTGSIFSREGVCRPFDAGADGTIKANGSVAVVLRRAGDARQAGDRSYAVITGTAVSNDGRDKAGFPAPGVEGQRRALQAALDLSGMRSEQLEYVETHGTGTALGDPIEIRALSRVYVRGTGPVCHLGALKGNIGHLDAAAGLAGLVKTALVVQHGVIPPLAGFRSPNPLLDLPATRFTVPTAAITPSAGVGLAAVSAFGMGGTNAHALLRPADAPVHRPADRPGTPVQLVVHGVDPEAVRRNREDLLDHLRVHPELELADVAHTLRVGRRADRYRITARVRDHRAEELAGAEVEVSPSRTGDLEPLLPGRRRVALPVTALRRERHWIDAPGMVFPADPSVRASLPGRVGPVTGALPTGTGGPTAATRAARATGAVGRPLPDPQAQVLAVMRRLLASPNLAADTDYYDAGGDSLTGITLLDELCDTFGVELEATDVDHFRTPRRLAERIRLLLATDQQPDQQAGPPRGPERAPAAGVFGNVVRLREGDDRHLFLIHPAGGTTACYVDLARHLDTPMTLHGLHYPMALRGQAPSIRDLAASYLAAIRQVQPEGNYLLGGYSFGGNLAVEMAIQLQAAGQEVSRLILIDAHPPHAYTGSNCEPDAYLKAFPFLLTVMFPEVELDPQAPLGSPQQVLAAVRHPQWSPGLRDQLAAFYDVWCDNHAALRRWMPDRVPDCPTVLVEASQPEPEQILDLLGIGSSPVREWDRYLAGPISSVGVEGDHYSIFRDPQRLKALGRRLSDALT